MTSFRWIYGLNFRRIIRRPSCHSGLAQDNRSLAQTPSPTCTPSLAGDALPRAQNSDLATSRPTFLVCHHERSEQSAFACVAMDILVGALFFPDGAPDSPTIGVLLCHHERSEGSTVACVERAFLSAFFSPTELQTHRQSVFCFVITSAARDLQLLVWNGHSCRRVFFLDRAPDSPTIGFLLCITSAATDLQLLVWQRTFLAARFSPTELQTHRQSVFCFVITSAARDLHFLDGVPGVLRSLQFAKLKSFTCLPSNWLSATPASPSDHAHLVTNSPSTPCYADRSSPSGTRS
jgi:hypothetical protein